MEYIRFRRLSKVIALKQKAFTNRVKDTGEFSYQEFSCVKHLVFRNAKTPN